MFDIYKLFYFVEETGMLIQEQFFKTTHPQIWECNVQKLKNKEQANVVENAQEMDMEFNLGQLGEIPEVVEIPNELLKENVVLRDSEQFSNIES